MNKVSTLSVKVGDCLISNRTSVNYLGCILDNDLSGVSMAMKVLGKVNDRNKCNAATRKNWPIPVLQQVKQLLDIQWRSGQLQGTQGLCN